MASGKSWAISAKIEQSIIAKLSPVEASMKLSWLYSQLYPARQPARPPGRQAARESTF